MLGYQNNELIIERIRTKMREINSTAGFLSPQNSDEDQKLITSPTKSNLLNPFFKQKSKTGEVYNKKISDGLQDNIKTKPFNIGKFSDKNENKIKQQSPLNRQKKQQSINEEPTQSKFHISTQPQSPRQGFRIQPKPAFSSVNQRFKIIKRLGKGCMADVYSALDLQTNQIVALKVIQKTLIQAKNLEEFLCLEIKILSYIKHPNAIKLYGVHDDNKQLYLVLELCELNLLQRIQKKQNYLKYDQILKYMYDLVDLVTHLHDQNIIHRDIKLENIMLRGDIIKLSDFGLAMYVPGLKEGSAYLRGRCGTKGYIAPEVDTNDLYNLKADIYSIGVAIHELYSGEPLKEVGVISRNLPPMLADLISKLCQKNPRSRYDAAKILTHPIFKQIKDSKNPEILNLQDLELLN